MSVAVKCDQCGQQYHVAEGLLGKRVKCAGCGAAFVAQAAAQDEAADPLFADLPAPDTANSGGPPGLGTRYPSPSSTKRPARPVEGPTDQQFRMGAAVGIPLVIIGMLLAFFAMRDLTYGAVMLVTIGPFVIFFGLAALVDPDIARAATKFGGHLPGRYKLIAFAVGLAALACSLTLGLWILRR